MLTQGLEHKINSQTALTQKQKIAMRNKQWFSSFSSSLLAHDDVKMAEVNLLKRSRYATSDKLIDVSSLYSGCV